MLRSNRKELRSAGSKWKKKWLNTKLPFYHALLAEFFWKWPLLRTFCRKKIKASAQDPCKHYITILLLNTPCSMTVFFLFLVTFFFFKTRRHPPCHPNLQPYHLSTGSNSLHSSDLSKPPVLYPYDHPEERCHRPLRHQQLQPGCFLFFLKF